MTDYDMDVDAPYAPTQSRESSHDREPHKDGKKKKETHKQDKSSTKDRVSEQPDKEFRPGKRPSEMGQAPSDEPQGRGRPDEPYQKSRPEDPHKKKQTEWKDEKRSDSDHSPPKRAVEKVVPKPTSVQMQRAQYEVAMQYAHYGSPMYYGAYGSVYGLPVYPPYAYAGYVQPPVDYTRTYAAPGEMHRMRVAGDGPPDTRRLTAVGSPYLPPSEEALAYYSQPIKPEPTKKSRGLCC